MGKSMVMKCGGVAALLLAISTWCFISTQHEQNFSATCLLIVVGLLSMACSIIAVDITYLGPADSHSLTSLILQYFSLRSGSIFGYIAARKFVTESKNIRKRQHKEFSYILRLNRNTEFGLRHGFSTIHSREEYSKKVPLSTFYPDYEQYIEKMARGEVNVLTSLPLISLLTTSGTTGKSKRIPVTANVFTRSRRVLGFVKFLSANINSMKRTFNLRYKFNVTYTECGLPVQTIGSLIARTQAYTVVPTSIQGAIDSCVATEYVSALFAIAERELVYLDTTFSNSCYSFFKLIEKDITSLCEDLACGTLSGHVEVSDQVRCDVNRSLKADPERADEVRRAVAKGEVGLAKALWPCMRHVSMLSTGSFEAAARLLESTYLKGVSHRGYGHGGSEGVYGVVVDNASCVGTQTAYACAINTAFFEFIPEDSINLDQPNVRYVDQLELGKCYELVITSEDGLYRYRVGDVIKVVGRFNECPMYEFQYRSGHILSLTFEKMDESTFFKALNTAQKRWEGPLCVDYTATENIHVETMLGVSDKGRPNYVIFIEIFAKDQSQLLSKRQKTMLDEALCEVSNEYRSERARHAIDPAKVIQVKQGTFANMKALLTKDNKNFQQYKTPRVMHRPEVLSLLFDSDVCKEEISGNVDT